MDKVIWILSSSRKFSCRSLRQELVNTKPCIPIWKVVWHIPTSPKIKLSFGSFFVEASLSKIVLASFQLIALEVNI